MVVALAAVMLVLIPAVAEARTKAQSEDNSISSIVVRPGDSLWSITSERLGPNATPQQIANAVERIYALNRGRIGADPNLIFPGQNLLLAPVARATPARSATESADNSATARATESAPEQPPRSTVSEADPKVRGASDTVNERAHLPDMARPAPVPEAMPLAQDDSVRSPAESLVSKARSAASAVASGTYIYGRLLGTVLLVLNFGLLLSLAFLVALKRQEAYERDVAENRRGRATPAAELEKSPVEHENEAAKPAPNGSRRTETRNEPAGRGAVRTAAYGNASKAGAGSSSNEEVAVSLVIPAYNEERRLSGTLGAYKRKLRERYEEGFEIIVVANGCSDATVGVARRAAANERDRRAGPRDRRAGGRAGARDRRAGPRDRRASARDPHIRVVEIEEAVGKGGAVLEGFRRARGAAVAFADADGATAPESLIELFEGLAHSDVVIGSRRVEGSTITRPQTPTRRLFGFLFASTARLLFGMPFRDTQCGAKAMRGKVACQLCNVVSETRWTFDLDLLLCARRLGLKISEHPVSWTDKEGSHLRYPSTTWEVLRALRGIKLRQRLPLKALPEPPILGEASERVPETDEKTPVPPRSA